MALNTEDLQNLLDEHKVTLADIEFIVKYMSTENISPQLAMRRIKSFDQLKEKLEDNKEKERIAELEAELAKTREELSSSQQSLQDLIDAKSGLEHEKQELESKSAILDSERDELQRQLQMLQEMHEEEEEEEEDEFQAGISALISILQDVVSAEDKMENILQPIIQSLKFIKENQNIGDLTTDKMETIAKTHLAAVAGSPSISSTTTQKSITSDDEDALVTPSKRASMQSTPVSSIKSKSKVSSKEKKKADSLMEKTRQVLNLFTEFITEADDDNAFQDRVATICDMDEAYAYLGSIGLSQVYSFATKGVSKKSELLKLLESWKKDGVPR